MTEKALVPAEKRKIEVEFIPMGAADSIRLNAALVHNFIAVPTKSGKLPTERDCIRFVMLCKGKKANPFEGDVFMIGYDSNDGPSFSMVCGIELFFKRAEQNEHYDGRKSGIIIQKKGQDELEYRPGCLLLKDELIVGGWAKVYRTDREHPEYKTVNFKVYDTGKSRWKKDPAGQIEKVALSQALRQAFPTLGGLYTQEEMQRVTEDGDNLDRLPIGMPEAIAPGEATPVITAGETQVATEGETWVCEGCSMENTEPADKREIECCYGCGLFRGEDVEAGHYAKLETTDGELEL